MAGLPWVKVAVDFAEHPKAIALAHQLSDPRAPLYLPPMWGFFARFYAAGSMPNSEVSIRALERAVLWEGGVGGLVAALIAVDLLERRGDRIVVHDWDEWQEGHARKIERDRARMREKRASAREKSRATGPGTGRAEEETERRGDEIASSARADARGREAKDEVSGPGVRPTAMPLTTAAPGPEKLAVVVDEVPRPALVVVDEGGGPPGPEPWPRARSFREAVTLRMARTVLYPIGGVEPKIMGSLDDSLGVIPEPEAVELCAARVHEAVQLRRRQPGSLAYFAQVLADEAVRRRALGAPPVSAASPAPMPDPGCAAWAALRGALQERVRAETFQRFHADLVGRVEGDVLVLTAPDRFHADFLRDNHREVFEGWARELGVAQAVRFEAADVAAAAVAGA